MLTDTRQHQKPPNRATTTQNDPRASTTRSQQPKISKITSDISPSRKACNTLQGVRGFSKQKVSRKKRILAKGVVYVIYTCIRDTKKFPKMSNSQKILRITNIFTQSYKSPRSLKNIGKSVQSQTSLPTNGKNL